MLQEPAPINSNGANGGVIGGSGCPARSGGDGGEVRTSYVTHCMSQVNVPHDADEQWHFPRELAKVLEVPRNRVKPPSIPSIGAPNAARHRW